MSEQVKHTPTLGCPFCGYIPNIMLGKKTHCSLHGDEAQSVIVKCFNPDCPANPTVETGDVYNGGPDKAKKEAIEKWNTRVIESSYERIEKERDSYQDLWFKMKAWLAYGTKTPDNLQAQSILNLMNKLELSSVKESK